MSGAEDFFGGGSKNPPALRFYPGPQQPYRSPDIGYVAGGQILEINVRQQRDYETGALKTWPDGNPQMQAETIVQTQQSGPWPISVFLEGDEDDGRRTLYVQGQMKAAIAEAVRQSGDASGVPKPGGYLILKCLSTYDQQAKKKKNTWAAQYAPGQLPAQSNDAFFGGQPQPTATQQFQQRPAPTAAQQEYASSVAPTMNMLDRIRNGGAGPDPMNQSEKPPF